MVRALYKTPFNDQGLVEGVARVDGQLRVRADRRPGRIRGRREPEGELSFFLFGNAGPSSTELLRFWGVLLRLKLPAET